MNDISQEMNQTRETRRTPVRTKITSVEFTEITESDLTEVILNSTLEMLRLLRYCKHQQY